MFCCAKINWCALKWSCTAVKNMCLLITRKKIEQGCIACENLDILLFNATPLWKKRCRSCPASICLSDATNLTVSRGGDRRWTLQQIAGLPEVLNLIKQMSTGIISEHQGGKVTEQRRGVRKCDRPKRLGLAKKRLLYSEKQYLFLEWVLCVFPPTV